MKNILEKIKEIKGRKNGSAILFFGFYLLFFIGVIVFLKFGSKSSLPLGEEYEKGNPGTMIRFDNILKNNYQFLYSVNLDDEVYQYDGVRYENQEMFKFLGADYYKDSTGVYLKDGVWNKVQNPYRFLEFFDINNIGALVKAATYQSKTSYDSGRETYSYLISSNTINQLLYNVNSDFLEEPNEMIIGTDEAKNVCDITFRLSSLCVLNRVCNKDLTIRINYDEFGEVEQIVSPLG